MLVVIVVIVGVGVAVALLLAVVVAVQTRLFEVSVSNYTGQVIVGVVRLVLKLEIDC